MKTEQKHESTSFFGSWRNLLLSGIAAIPAWQIANYFTENWQIQDDEAMATALVIFGLLALFSGRYMAYAWRNKAFEQMQTVILLLSVLIAAPVMTLFLMMDFTSTALRGLKLSLVTVCFLLIGFASGVLIKLIKSYQEQKLREAQLTADKSQVELRALQAQLSPHFLFNTLNNLYGLSISQPSQLPQLLLKLSDLLRYSVYGSKELMVPLKDELIYIQHYIDFERIRIDHRYQINCSLEDGIMLNDVIAPMVLIVFVENAFKHARHTEDDTIFITIRLEVLPKELVFVVENSCAEETVFVRGVEESSGFGLENLRQRLDLIYPKEHLLTIQQFNGRFKTELRLKRYVS